jgi:proteasome lid subunit RPN8/RPN11
MTTLLPDQGVNDSAPAENWARLDQCSLAEETRELLQLRASRHDIEVCGFIVDANTIVPVANTHATPRVNFNMDRKSILNAANEYGPSITGIYHSHPSGRTGLTQSDKDGMKTLYRAGCPWRYFIVTIDAVTEYQWIG